MAKRIGGTIYFSVNGIRYQAKGSFTYNLGRPMREGVVGVDEVHGYTEKPQVPKIEGSITDGLDLDLESFLAVTDATVTLELANGKTVTLFDAWNASSGDVSTEEGEIEAKFEGIRATES
jgi:plastocyanin domain-containing protein